MSFLLLLNLSNRINKKDYLTERIRNEYLDKIIRRFADEIDSKGGFKKSSKTGTRCQKKGTYDGIKAMMERWFLIQELYGANKGDLLVPSDPKEDKWLRRELSEGGFSEADQIELDKKLVDITKKLYFEFNEEISKIEDGNIKIVLDGDIFRIVDEKEVKTQKISKEYRDKLLKKYQEKHPEATEKDPAFLSSLLLLLLRYNTVSGDANGYQEALPAEVFRYLKENYHLQHECFASPLNACSEIGSFCSRFIDRDEPFGSKGSFFEYSVEEGCYESNPPFVEECMIRNIKHINSMLEAAQKKQKSLTFFIIVPKWDDADCESYNLTYYGTEDRPENENEKNRFFVKIVEVNKFCHFYRNGMAHQDDYSVMKSNQDSLLFVLQTEEAKQNNPLQDDFEEIVRKKWSMYSEEYKKNNNKKRESSGKIRYDKSLNLSSYNYHSNYDRRSKRRDHSSNDNNDTSKRGRF